MTEKEMVRLKVAKRLIGKEMKVEEAARILNISNRQVIRIRGMVKNDIDYLIVVLCQKVC